MGISPSHAKIRLIRNALNQAEKVKRGKPLSADSPADRGRGPLPLVVISQENNSLALDRFCGGHDDGTQRSGASRKVHVLPARD
jgi:hypothetical protein